jgi:hypothetical protein
LLKVGLTYQYQLSWLLDADLEVADALRIPYMPMHIVGFSADLSWKSPPRAGGTKAGGSLRFSAHWESLTKD